MDKIYESFVTAYQKSLKLTETCPSLQQDTDQILTDHIYEEYGVPMFTARINCCRYPPVNNLPYIWRETLEPSMNFLNQLRTGSYYRNLFFCF